MSTKHDNLKDRTKKFALRTIRLVEALPKGKTAAVIGKQLVRSGTRLQPVTALPAAPGQMPTVSLRWALSKKKPMKHCSGWNCSLMLN